MDEKRSLREEIFETVRIVIVALLVVIPIRIFVAQPFIVRGASMKPNFLDG
ncbi:MAG: S26 family signal peptidase, partial [Candidatus Ryanbacteria bacterium]|nr:S26 family signal peptidase [Candidatus Ryanbacteria bacterium]